MYMCKYDISKECNGIYKDCVECVLTGVESDIENMFPHVTQNEYCDGYDSCRKDAVEVIQKRIDVLKGNIKSFCDVVEIVDGSN